MSLIGKEAPDFVAQAVKNGEIIQVSLNDYKGKFVVLFFYPLDFTFVCPTELVAFAECSHEFANRNCEILAVSIDSVYTHRAFWQQEISQVGYPIVSDLSKSICQSYGTLMEKGISLRATYIIDADGIVQHVSFNNLGFGRSVEETLRLVDAIQFHQEFGEVCPANWQKGEKGICPV